MVIQRLTTPLILAHGQLIPALLAALAIVLTVATVINTILTLPIALIVTSRFRQLRSRTSRVLVFCAVALTTFMILCFIEILVLLVWLLVNDSINSPS